MGTVAQPVPNALADSPLSTPLFDIDEPLPVHGKATDKKPKPAAPRRAGRKSVLEAKDFLLPERVTRADNGDLSVSIAQSTDAVQVEQIFRLAEYGEEIGPNFLDLSYEFCLDSLIS